MKKFSFILIIAILFPILLTCTACKNEEKRSVEEFYNSYLDISTYSTSLKEEKLDERFSADSNLYLVKFNFSLELQSKINLADSAYNKIVTFYDVLLEDVSAPIIMYGRNFNNNNCSKEDIKEIFSRLDELKNAYIATTTRLNDLELTLNEPILAQSNLKQLFSSYENLIFKASNLSSKISSIYFNNVMQSPNPDYQSQKYSDIDLRDVAIRALNRRVYYTSVYADIYLNLFILGNNIPEKIISSATIETFTPYKTMAESNYTNTLKELESNRAQIVDLARSLYLIQTDFDKEYQNYHTAIEKITYSLVDNSSSNESIGYKQVVDQFSGKNGIAYSSFLTLTSLLDLCFEKG